MLKKSLTALTLCAAIALPVAGFSAAHESAENQIMQRKAGMKAVGGSMKTLGGMMQGKVAFDKDAAIAALSAMNMSAKGFADLFPEGTETGGETEASPKIWSDRAGFEAAAMKFEADTAAAVAAAPADLDALKAVFGSVAGNCKACHTEYRVSK